MPVRRIHSYTVLTMVVFAMLCPVVWAEQPAPHASDATPAVENPASNDVASPPPVVQPAQPVTTPPVADRRVQEPPPVEIVNGLKEVKFSRPTLQKIDEVFSQQKAVSREVFHNVVEDLKKKDPSFTDVQAQELSRLYDSKLGVIPPEKIGPQLSAAARKVLESDRAQPGTSSTESLKPELDRNKTAALKSNSPLDSDFFGKNVKEGQEKEGKEGKEGEDGEKNKDKEKDGPIAQAAPQAENKQRGELLEALKLVLGNKDKDKDKDEDDSPSKNDSNANQPPPPVADNGRDDDEDEDDRDFPPPPPSKSEQGANNSLLAALAANKNNSNSDSDKSKKDEEDDTPKSSAPKEKKSNVPPPEEKLSKLSDDKPEEEPLQPPDDLLSAAQNLAAGPPPNKVPLPALPPPGGGGGGMPPGMDPGAAAAQNGGGGGGGAAGGGGGSMGGGLPSAFQGDPFGSVGMEPGVGGPSNFNYLRMAEFGSAGASGESATVGEGSGYGDGSLAKRVATSIQDEVRTTSTEDNSISILERFHGKLEEYVCQAPEAERVAVCVRLAETQKNQRPQ